MEPANILKIESLSNNWRDKDDIILHACFQILKNFVEQEKEMIEVIDWGYEEKTKKAKLEIDFLYLWWVDRIDKEDHLNEKQYEVDNQMLKRLIDVRKYLWT
ncbi:MAG: hypothetical protein WKF90_09425 [Pyrinomonadaceae bacterium]